jgi:hypothetical protein
MHITRRPGILICTRSRSVLLMIMSLEDIYPACLAVLGKESWARLLTACAEISDAGTFPDFLERAKTPDMPPFLPDLARLEWAVASAAGESHLIPPETETLSVNPVIRLMELSWRGLTPLLHPDTTAGAVMPERGSERVLVWFDPKSGRTRARPASDEDFLVLKMVMEGDRAGNRCRRRHLPWAPSMRQSAAPFGAVSCLPAVAHQAGPVFNRQEKRRGVFSSRLLPSSGISPRPATCTASTIMTGRPFTAHARPGDNGPRRPAVVREEQTRAGLSRSPAETRSSILISTPFTAPP